MYISYKSITLRATYNAYLWEHTLKLSLIFHIHGQAHIYPIYSQRVNSTKSNRAEMLQFFVDLITNQLDFQNKSLLTRIKHGLHRAYKHL